MTNIEEDIRYITYKATSNMLDNPDKYGIYPTGELYDRIEREVAFYIRSKLEELGEEIKSEADRRRGGYGNMDTVPGLYQGVDAAVERMTKGKK